MKSLFSTEKTRGTFTGSIHHKQYGDCIGQMSRCHIADSVKALLGSKVGLGRMLQTIECSPNELLELG